MLAIGIPSTIKKMVPLATSMIHQASFQISYFHTSPAMEGWPRGPKRTRIKFHPTTLRARKARDSIEAYPKTVWGKRLLGEMKDRNLMESDPWVKNQLELKYGHRPKWKRI